jgi:hypothetical protein
MSELAASRGVNVYQCHPIEVRFVVKRMLDLLCYFLFQTLAIWLEIRHRCSQIWRCAPCELRVYDPWRQDGKHELRGRELQIAQLQLTSDWSTCCHPASRPRRWGKGSAPGIVVRS